MEYGNYMQKLNILMKNYVNSRQFTQVILRKFTLNFLKWVPIHTTVETLDLS